MNFKILVLVVLFLVLQGCQTTYSAAKNELISEGTDYLSVSFFPTKTLKTPQDEKLSEDLKDCVNSLEKEFGRPKSLRLGQEQMKKCMIEKDWFVLENVHVS